MDIGTTGRGFDIVNFYDANGVACSVQQSSAIGDEDGDFDKPGSSFLWIGPDDASPKTRMHLTRDQVRELVGVLQAWLKSGRLSV